MNIPVFLRPLAAVVFLLSLSSFLFAQDSKVYVVDTEVTADEIVDVEVRGVALTTAVGIQISLGWDSTVLAFQGVKDVIAGGSLEGNFNQTRLENGQIGYFFYDESLQGLNLVDSGLLFTLQLKPLVTNSAVSKIDFIDEPLNTLMTTASLDSIPVELIAGNVEIDMSSGRRNVLAEDRRLTASPNPFTEHCRLEFSPGYAGTASLEILDAAGRKVFQRAQRFGAGNNKINLNAADLPAAGTYIIRIVTDREQLHRKLVLGRNGRF